MSESWMNESCLTSHVSYITHFWTLLIWDVTLGYVTWLVNMWHGSVSCDMTERHDSLMCVPHEWSCHQVPMSQRRQSMYLYIPCFEWVMSHESCHIYQWVVSHMKESHLQEPMSRRRQSIVYAFRWVMSHELWICETWLIRHWDMRHSHTHTHTHSFMNECIMNEWMSESRLTGRLKYIHESRLTWVMSEWMSRVSHEWWVNEWVTSHKSCRIYQLVVSHMNDERWGAGVECHFQKN